MDHTTDKGSTKTKCLASLLCHGPRVHIRFDKGQEFYNGKKPTPLFSWQTKGDFSIPLIPAAVTLLAATVLLGTAARDKK